MKREQKTTYKRIARDIDKLLELSNENHLEYNYLNIAKKAINNAYADRMLRK